MQRATMAECPGLIDKGTARENVVSLRYCKAYLRRRLAHGPPRPDACSHPSMAETHVNSSGCDYAGDGQHDWRRLWPRGREMQCEELRKVLRRTIVERESQSALLLGYKGCGKSLVLERVLRSLALEIGPGANDRAAKRQRCSKGTSNEHMPADGEGGGTDRGLERPFRAVYLNGMVQTDDGVAMREIVQQLGGTGTRGAMYSSNLEMAVETMKTGAINGIPVVFVLDEFERFSCRRPQTLLYALLDLCQDKGVCAAVVGLSTNLNVLDVAEKRIKSRFSFRQVRFPPHDFDTIVSIMLEALMIPEGCDSGNPSDDRGPRPAGVTAAFARDFNSITRQTLVGDECGTGNARGSRGSPRSARADLKALAASGSNIGWFLRLASTAVSLLGEGRTELENSRGGAVEMGLTRRALLRAAEMLAPDPHMQALRSLNVTQLLVLVTIARLGQRGRKRDGCSFHAVFREYESYIRKFPSCPLRFPRAVVFKAYRQLAEQGLVRAAEAGT